jgi:hypothetical protein
MTKLYLNDSITESLATGYNNPHWLLDMTETQGTPATVATGDVTTTEQQVIRFFKTVGLAGENGVFQFSLKVSATTGSQAGFYTTLRRFGSGGFDYKQSSIYTDLLPGVGIYTHNIAFSAAWAVDDVLVVDVRGKATPKIGTATWDFDLNDPDSFLDCPVASEAGLSSNSISTGISL